MTVKLSLLKSGEDVIADIQEMVVGEGENTRVIGYFFENPCVVKILAKTFDDTGETKTPCKLQLTPWMPLSSDSRIPIPPDWIVTLVEPIAQLKEMYETGVNKNDESDQDSSTNQQSDSNQSD